ncbi:hypothetical protein PAXRUDRAFT_710740 [Paxillus rubicundulus Ve08.2h10]|uniref:Uncharacterized protein n=1 Tax=Paxillus rubicundulus Ve08.2h10 TaxID=930991 RepID=A0A0D0CIM2_9AGAM|nr:hypothetical protein PAXRUDRAFT_710740 [Paxillus rubicundulus Ve08.2h10]
MQCSACSKTRMSLTRFHLSRRVSEPQDHQMGVRIKWRQVTKGKNLRVMKRTKRMKEVPVRGKDKEVRTRTLT